MHAAVQHRVDGSLAGAGALALDFIATPLKFIASALTLVWIGVCVGYVVRDVQGQDAET